jgi:hypothetical protein
MQKYSFRGILQTHQPADELGKALLADRDPAAMDIVHSQQLPDRIGMLFEQLEVKDTGTVPSSTQKDVFPARLYWNTVLRKCVVKLEHILGRLLAGLDQ